LFGNTVLTVDSVLNAIGRMLEAAVSRDTRELAVRQCRTGHSVVAIVLLSVSRSAALAKYYTAFALTIYTALAFQPVPVQPTQRDQNRSCWRVRVASGIISASFIFRTVQLGFLPSVGFTGHKPFQVWLTHTRKKTLQLPNDENRQEMERYVDMADCTWIIDLGGEC
jgi:hypothetical protein